MDATIWIPEQSGLDPKRTCDDHSASSEFPQHEPCAWRQHAHHETPSSSSAEGFPQRWQGSGSGSWDILDCGTVAGFDNSAVPSPLPLAPRVFKKQRMPLRTKDFDFHLPDELIAARPLADRSASKMLVVHRESGVIEHRMFREFPEFLRPNDLLVLNDTKVIPARVFSDDGKVELLCLDRPSPLEWRCLVRPGKRMKHGYSITVGNISGVVIEVYENGDRLVRWDSPVDLDRHLEEVPEMVRDSGGIH